MTSAPVSAQGITNPLIKQLAGWQFRETGGANPVVVRLRDGSVTGAILASIRLVANESKPADNTGPEPLATANGVFVEVAGTGTVEGAVYGY